MNRMTQPIYALGGILGALWVLASIAVYSKFNLNSSYWNWRINTAFPSAMKPIGRVQRTRLILEYARWASRIRRFR